MKHLPIAPSKNWFSRRSALASLKVFSLCWVMCIGSALGQTVDSVLTNRLFEPYGIAAEGSTYYITDSANNRIVKYVPDNGAFTVLAGLAEQTGSADGRGIFARFSNPRGIVRSPSRNGFVVADSANHTLRLVRLSGEVTTIAGAAGVPGFNADPVLAGNARFNFPSGLAADAAGNIYIADSKNNAIRKLDVNDVVTTLAANLRNEFFEPAGVTVWDGGRIVVADTRNHSIKVIEANGTVSTLAGRNSRFESGDQDSPFADEALFSNPSSVLWLGGNAGFLICDTGNHTIRRLFFSEDVNGLSVETYAGTSGQGGLVDGQKLLAKFRSPVSLVKDPNGGFLIVDLANHALRRIMNSPPLPPVMKPQIGWVTFVKDEFGELLSQLVPVGQSIFNNDVTIAVVAEAGTETYFTYGATPPSALEDNIESPNRLSGNSPPAYKDGLRPGEVPPSMIGPLPDVTIKAIGIQDGRRPSEVTQSRFQFKTANPIILGENAASFVLTNITFGSEMWYTLNGTEPTNNPSLSIGPIGSGEKISLPRSATNQIFKVKAFRSSYKPSEIISKTFEVSDYNANRISFGFEGGEASSQFQGFAGQTFFAPVTLSVLPNQPIYSLQFNVTVTNLYGSEAVAPGRVGFDSMLVTPLPGTEPPVYVTIPPASFSSFTVEIWTNIINAQSLAFTNFTPIFTNLLVTNFTQNLLAVGWLERFGRTNLFDTTKQDLITYSQAHDRVFLSTQNKIILGGYSFQIPVAATDGSAYEINLDRPSGTEDGVAADVFIEAPREGSRLAGSINATKEVRVLSGGIGPGQLFYVVGDVAPFRWFNAGDFGDTNLLNNDVLQVFQSAVYSLNMPPGDSDFWDAMDSSDGTVANLAPADGNDRIIDDVTRGDGQLNVDDVFVTFRRSLDPSLKWFARYWSNGIPQSVEIPNRFRGLANLPAEEVPGDLAGELSPEIPGAPGVSFAIRNAQGHPNQLIRVPVHVTVTGKLPIRVLMLGVTAVPLAGAPELSEAIRWIPSERLGTPSLSSSFGPGNYSAAWLNHRISGIRGEHVVGTVEMRIPANASPLSAYRLQIDHVSASPDGLSLFPKAAQSGLLTTADRTLSSWSDPIPDAWRLLHFGSAALGFSKASVSSDPDQDGLANIEEFLAGTDPLDEKSVLRLSTAQVRSADGRVEGVTLRWKAAADKVYVLEYSSDPLRTDWAELHRGRSFGGGEMEFFDAGSRSENRFYRLKLID